MVIMMSWNQIPGSWQQFARGTKARWGKLKDHELAETEGKRDALVGLIQARYGIKPEEAQRRVAEWERSYASQDRGPAHA